MNNSPFYLVKLVTYSLTCICACILVLLFIYTIRIYFLFFQSKGGILSKACDYITELKTANLRMSESLKETERLSVDLELLRQQCEELKSENSILRAQLQSHGLIPDIPGSNS